MQYSRNSRVDGHVSAHETPNGARVIGPACGRPHEPRTRTSVPFMMPFWGLGSRFDVGSRYSSARDRGPSKQSLAPARRGAGNCAGANDVPMVSEESASAAGNSRAGLLSVAFSTRSPRMQAACPPCNTLQHHIVSHFSVHGIPDGPCLVPSACGSMQWNARTRPRSPS